MKGIILHRKIYALLLEDLFSKLYVPSIFSLDVPVLHHISSSSLKHTSSLVDGSDIYFYFLLFFLLLDCWNLLKDESFVRFSFFQKKK